MTPMHVDHSITGDLSEPEPKRQDRVPQIIGEAPAGFQQHALHHIARIFATTEGPIEPRSDHAPERLAVTCQQAIDSRRFIACRVFQHRSRFSRIRPHELAPSHAPKAIQIDRTSIPTRSPVVYRMRPADLIDAQCLRESREFSLASLWSQHKHLIKSKQPCAWWQNNLSALSRHVFLHAVSKARNDAVKLHPALSVRIEGAFGKLEFIFADFRAQVQFPRIQRLPVFVQKYLFDRDGGHQGDGCPEFPVVRFRGAELCRAGKLVVERLSVEWNGLPRWQLLEREATIRTGEAGLIPVRAFGSSEIAGTGNDSRVPRGRAIGKCAGPGNNNELSCDRGHHEFYVLLAPGKLKCGDRIGAFAFGYLVFEIDANGRSHQGERCVTAQNRTSPCPARRCRR